MKKLILFSILFLASLPLRAQEEEPQPEEPAVERILQTGVWVVADKLDFEATPELPYRFAIGAPRCNTNLHYFVAGQYKSLNLTAAIKFGTSANTINGEGIVKGVSTAGNTYASEYYNGEVAPIYEISKTDDGKYNIAYIYSNASKSVLEKRWIGHYNTTKSLCYVNSDEHSSTPPTKTDNYVIADLTFKWKETGNGKGYYQIWWGKYILKAQSSSTNTSAYTTFKNNGYPVTFYWGTKEGNSYSNSSSNTNQDVEARLYVAKQISYTNEYFRELGITTPSGETVTFPLTKSRNLNIWFPLADKYQLDTIRMSTKIKDQSGTPVLHVSNGGYLKSSLSDDYKTIGRYSSKDSLEWRFIIMRPGKNDFVERAAYIAVESPPNLYSDDNIAFFAQERDSLRISFGVGQIVHDYLINNEKLGNLSYKDKQSLTINCPSYGNTIVGGFSRTLSPEGDKVIYTPVNHVIWNKPSEEEYNSLMMQDYFLWEENDDINFSFSQVNSIRLHPSKTDIALNQTSLSHRKSIEAGAERLSFPVGLFEPGTDTQHYARVVITPQFPTFSNPFEAEDYYGEERQGFGYDSWLSGEWYEEKGLEGFMPEMQWDEEKQEYFCELNGHDMTYVDHEGNRSEGNTLVSGHYKAKIVPSLGENDRQYGIVASDPVDIFIYPSLYDMKMHLCVRDDKDGDPRWEPYDISNEDFSFEGPKATDDGETAYRHARLQPAADFCEVWVESPRHRPAYPEGQIPGQKPAEKTARKAAPRAALVSGDLTGYTKVEPDDYIDLSGTKPVNIKLVKNGVASPAQAINVVKTGDEIVTGIDELRPDQLQADAEYFTPAGLRVAKPTLPGIYIERRASKARKIILR